MKPSQSPHQTNKLKLLVPTKADYFECNVHLTCTVNAIAWFTCKRTRLQLIVDEQWRTQKFIFGV